MAERKYNAAGGLASLLRGFSGGRQQATQNNLDQNKADIAAAEVMGRQRYYDAMAQNAASKNDWMANLQGLVGPGQMRIKSIGPNGPVLEPDAPPELTPGQKVAKDKRTEAIFESNEQYTMKKGLIDEAEKILPNAPVGMVGKLRVEWMKRFDPNNPVLADWQKIKSIATDAQLMNTAKTKGAISDKEMDLFATAAANDDLLSAPRLVPILSKIEKALESDREAKFDAYKQMYGEDPRTWFEQSEGNESEKGGDADPLGLRS